MFTIPQEEDLDFLVDNPRTSGNVCKGLREEYKVVCVALANPLCECVVKVTLNCVLEIAWYIRSPAGLLIFALFDDDDNRREDVGLVEGKQSETNTGTKLLVRYIIKRSNNGTQIKECWDSTSRVRHMVKGADEVIYPMVRWGWNSLDPVVVI